jgi:hypothetical protein
MIGQIDNWPAAWARLRELAGDAWDAEAERLDRLWKTAYQEAFLAYALNRRGWDRKNAAVWASEIVDAALIELGGDPEAAARQDVLACELESHGDQ